METEERRHTLKNVLEVNDLTVTCRQGKKITTLVDGLSFQVEEGKCLGILGESGSGKSMTMKGMLGLLDKGFTAVGQAHFYGRNLLKASTEELRKLRGGDITMVLQNPMSCFDPLSRIGSQMEETFTTHRRLNASQLDELKISTLERMQIKNPEEVLKKYPHQLSGGMLQRVMIGLAIALEPKLIIADEPTTAIDTITQHEILEDMLRIKATGKTSMIFISHDLGVISRMADHIIVMYKGKAVDGGTMERIIANSQDQYTRELVESRMKVLSRFDQVMASSKEVIQW